MKSRPVYEGTAEASRKALKEQKEYQDKYADCNRKDPALEAEIQDLNGKRETFEKEKESLIKVMQ